ncbi:purine and uridine phosphorylase [Aspergillus sclerotioniger CBS 115572]|uniref:Purine and uridine phosphorylase n=1 Tax=Aspergillus sclerotioniger CBS 115572 TaxID=1450535 RepID=A0A317XAR2_9EURO|nr:purine and uridine phosphorylase [Aspergillus sclerotioniger CBS 115572]PWY94657.1 purine and uridine phosphorylase [Aspergillus sclerotioniger CBS 115572]
MAQNAWTHDDYRVGWLCTTPIEVNAARTMLDVEHGSLPTDQADDNSYILGEINRHTVVIAYPALYAQTNAPHVVSNMLSAFPRIRFGLSVGICGAAPSEPDLVNPLEDIRLGDVVVAEPGESHNGVCYYDSDLLETQNVFETNFRVRKPPAILQRAMRKLKSDHVLGNSQMVNYYNQAVTQRAAQLPLLAPYQFPGWNYDRLFEWDYAHATTAGNNGCAQCDPTRLVVRGNRRSVDPVVHYGLIACGQTPLQSGAVRNRLRNSAVERNLDHDIYCFDTEAAGLGNKFSCVLIRGICDYSDGHRNKIWEPYAAVTAAAYAKDLLRVISREAVDHTMLMAKALEVCKFREISFD